MSEIMNAYKSMWLHYADFNGRTSVKTYWSAILGNFIITIALSVLCGIIFSIFAFASESGAGIGFVVICAILGLYMLAILVPSLSIAARRLHDAGFPALLLLVTFVPTVGQVALIVMLCLPSNTEGKYGPPEEEEEIEIIKFGSQEN